jgi:hypothetical protein
MVLFDLPSTGLEILLDGCKNLQSLSLVADRNVIPALCKVSHQLQKLKSLDLTIHIGVTGDMVMSLVDAKATTRLKALKFHSKHATIFNDETFHKFVQASTLLEYMELNADELSANALLHVADILGVNLQSFLIHHGTISNESFQAISKSFKSVREFTATDLQQHKVEPDPSLSKIVQHSLSNNSNILYSLVRSTAFSHKLKKIELASFSGFSDSDLSTIPSHCNNLQWIDFHFSFTFPKTLTSIIKNCPNVMYLRLSRNSSMTQGALFSTPNGGIAVPTSATATATTPLNQTTPKNSTAGSRPRRKSSVNNNTFLCSSSETQSFLLLSGIPKNLRRIKLSSSSNSQPTFVTPLTKLRVLDLTGDIGLSDYTMKCLGIGLKPVHTLFLDGIDSISEKGVISFAELRYRSLKRCHVRNCKNVCLGVVGENYLCKALEVDLVIDGGRVAGSARFVDEA